MESNLKMDIRSILLFCLALSCIVAGFYSTSWTGACACNRTASGILRYTGKCCQLKCPVKIPIGTTEEVPCLAIAEVAEE